MFCIAVHQGTWKINVCLDHLLNTVTKKNLEYIVLGDFNINLLNHETDSETGQH